MKWFKHISDSLDDPFIFDVVSRFGGDGYMVFFGVLEVLAREFDQNSPETCTVSERFLTKKLQLSRQKLVKILSFFHEKERVFCTFADGRITLNCPKFVDMCDEWTRKRLRSSSGVTPEKLQHEAEAEVEAEVEEEEEHPSPSAQDVCAAPCPGDRSTPPPAISMPINPQGKGNQDEEPISEAEVAEWVTAYGNIDVRQVLQHMRQYWLARPKSERKTRRGIRKSITTWLAKDNDRARASPAKPQAATALFSTTKRGASGTHAGIIRENPFPPGPGSA